MLKIVNETTKFINTVVFGKKSLSKKLHATLLNVVLDEVKKFWGSKNFLIFLKMISTDALQVGFLVVFINDRFSKRSF